jgi:hypothetical protein
MDMNLKLVDGDRVLFELVLPDPKGQPTGRNQPFDVAESEMERLRAFYSMGANQKRLKVMMELARGGELRFSDVMQIATNPKLAQDCLQPMLKEGIVVHGGRGSGYKIPERALPLVVTLTVGLAKMLALLEREPEDEEEGALQ